MTFKFIIPIDAPTRAAAEADAAEIQNLLRLFPPPANAPEGPTFRRPGKLEEADPQA